MYEQYNEEIDRCCCDKQLNKFYTIKENTLLPIVHIQLFTSDKSSNKINDEKEYCNIKISRVE